MAIDVEWRDERGARLERYEGEPIGDLRAHAPAGSTCLRFIDPWGDTTFNAAQVLALEEELVELTNADGDIARRARSLLSFVRQRGDRTHLYLKFIGD